MKALKMMTILLAAFLMTSCGQNEQSSSSDTGAFDFRDEETGVQVTFPGKPQIDETETQNGGKSRMAQHSGESINLNLALMQSDFELTDEMYGEMKKAAQAGFVDQGFSLDSMRDTTFNGTTAIYLVGSRDDESMTMFYSVFEGLTVAMGANGFKGGSYKKMTEDYFASFKMTKEIAAVVR